MVQITEGLFASTVRMSLFARAGGDTSASARLQKEIPFAHPSNRWSTQVSMPPELGLLRDQTYTAQVTKVNCVRRVNFWCKVRTPPCVHAGGDTSDGVRVRERRAPCFFVQIFFLLKYPNFLFVQTSELLFFHAGWWRRKCWRACPRAARTRPPRTSCAASRRSVHLKSRPPPIVILGRSAAPGRDCCQFFCRRVGTTMCIYMYR